MKKMYQICRTWGLYIHITHTPHNGKWFFFCMGGCLLPIPLPTFWRFANCLITSYLRTVTAHTTHPHHFYNCLSISYLALVAISFADTKRESVTPWLSTTYTYIFGGNTLFVTHWLPDSYILSFIVPLWVDYHIRKKTPKNTNFIAKFSWE